MMQIFFYLLWVVRIFDTNPSLDTLEKQWTLADDEAVAIELKFAEHIELISSKSKQLKVVVEMEFDTDFSYEEVYQLAGESEDGQLYIQSVYDFEKLKREELVVNNTTVSSQVHFKTLYKIYVPAGHSLSLKTISGNVEVRAVPNAMNIKTVSGYIDVDWSENWGGAFRFSTIEGEIYTDFDFRKKQGSGVGLKLAQEYKGGGKLIQLKAVSGDIYLRKAGV
ncbi:hypothetical protein [Persicobacter diffluens]|uniref:Adhesin domain-containing protein n=1 Tax=Persicobacter diffluens TaxID=981 RepID=A0AAN4W0V6_9BACT|nr:hypothetical protein PEDI_24020 [Persicobacter diffluens]